ncbi:72 kDa type IV collagenase-like isoform X2 [Lytechinus variegatus]|uniref:72 kDa type IV collagenase-like isoform X2 n=1 Tax=Lytechinus variegatus TaxID=7654 RepID=UPI001BB21EA8|nr:72 kDa type IV collagenase-like isoform X2 [Lytechinus variegatus]
MEVYVRTSASSRNILILVLSTCLTLNLSHGTPIQDNAREDLALSLPYLYQFGYFSTDSIEPGKTPGETLGSEQFQRAVSEFQRFANIDITGTITDETKFMMEKPRCGNKDTQPHTNRVRRYNVAGGNYKWNKETLTYRIENFPTMRKSSSINEFQVRHDVRMAFKLWSDVTPLVFVEVHDETVEVDIELRFGSRVHTSVYGDPAFDGEGGTLAHAFTPNSGWGKTNGDVHFDDDEHFTHKVYSGINLFYTAAHEIGHALGLDHSDQRNSLMWPWDKGYIPNFRLPLDDRLGIQVIYGKNPFQVSTDPPPTTQTTTTQPPILIPPYCNTSLDAVADIRGNLMIFKGKKMWRFRPNYNSEGYPDGTFPLVAVDTDMGILTEQFFRGIKQGMKAVYERQDNKIVFLKARKKWIYDGTTLYQGPVRVSPSPNGYPLTVYAALYDKTSGLTHLFKGNKVWLYNEALGTIEKSTLKKVFKGLHPSARVNGAFMLNNHKFLLDGPDYYEANEDNYVPNIGKRNFGVDILGCPPTSPPQIY